VEAFNNFAMTPNNFPTKQLKKQTKKQLSHKPPQKKKGPSVNDHIRTEFEAFHGSERGLFITGIKENRGGPRVQWPP